jgi:hypothetical protein
MVRVAVVLPAELEAVTVKLAVAVTAVGVPLMMPVLVLTLSPAGRAGLTLYVLTAPPLLVGLFGVICTPLV